MVRRWAVMAALTLAASAQAQRAVPWYTPQQWINSIDAGWIVPRAPWPSTLPPNACAPRWLHHVTHCGWRAARPLWVEAMRAWEALSSAELGPVVEKRSARRVDFQPTRPKLIEEALTQPPADASAIEQAGGAAKGLPALEYLLWQRTDHAATCVYAALVADDLSREALALREDASRLPPALELDEVRLKMRTEELVNQWIGGAESLRWHSMGKPLESAAKGKPPAYPRATSGAVREAWMAQWGSLHALAAWPVRKAPPSVAQEMTEVVPLALYLRSRGLLDWADRLDVALARADRDVRAAWPQRTVSVLAAMKSLATLRTLVETRVAEALKVSVYFTGADGD